MGYIVDGKLLKYHNAYLFQRKCNVCAEKYLFNILETETSKVFFCESCTPTQVLSMERTFTKAGAVRVLKWHNRVVETDKTYKTRRHSTRNYRKVLQRDKFICQYCYQDGDTIDHIKPIICGGGNQEWNLVCCCRRCNSTASYLIFGDWTEKRAYIINKIKSVSSGKLSGL